MKPEEYRPRLLHFHGDKHGVRVREVSWISVHLASNKIHIHWGCHPFTDTCQLNWKGLSAFLETDVTIYLNTPTVLSRRSHMLIVKLVSFSQKGLIATKVNPLSFSKYCFFPIYRQPNTKDILFVLLGYSSGSQREIPCTCGWLTYGKRNLHPSSALHELYILQFYCCITQPFACIVQSGALSWALSSSNPITQTLRKPNGAELRGNPRPLTPQIRPVWVW